METPRWSGWEVRASRMESSRQRLRSWTLRAHELDDALRSACEWRSEWSGDDPDALLEAVQSALGKRLRRRILAWRARSDA